MNEIDLRPDGGPAVEVRGLWAGYNGNAVIEDVAFTVAPGSLVGLVGPNGSGKTTLLRTILGLHQPWRGDVYVLGQRGPQARRRLGYMPQAEVVDWRFPVTVFDVAMMGRYSRLGLLRRPGQRDREVVWRCLEQVGMTAAAGQQVGELSGGQQRRLLIARALAQEAPVLLLDEPMAGLDATSQHDLLSLFDHLRHAGKTLLVATHDLSCVAAGFDHALLLNRRLIAGGPPAAVLTEELLTATFQRHLLLLNIEGRLRVGHE